MKIGYVNTICSACLCLMITGYSKPSAALIPLPTFDASRISQTIAQVGHTITSIQYEIQRNMLIIKEIQNGGFGAAAGMLLAGVESGAYGMLLGDLNNLKGTWAEQAIEREYNNKLKTECNEEREKIIKEERDFMDKNCASSETSEQLQKCKAAAETSIEEAGKAAYAKCAEIANKARLEAINDLRQKTAEQNKKLLAGEEYVPESGNVKFSNVYSWAKNANLSAGVNAISNGDASGIISTFGQSASGTYNSITGDESGSSFISGVVGVSSGSVSELSGDGNFIDKAKNIMENSDVQSGFSNIKERTEEKEEKTDNSYSLPDRITNPSPLEEMMKPKVELQQPTKNFKYEKMQWKNGFNKPADNNTTESGIK